MKQQLKRIVAAEITVLQYELLDIKGQVVYFERRSNKDDTSTVHYFQTLNRYKQLMRKTQRKLKKLVALQNEIKSMVGYMTAEAEPTIRISNFKVVS